MAFRNHRASLTHFRVRLDFVVQAFLRSEKNFQHLLFTFRRSPLHGIPPPTEVSHFLIINTAAEEGQRLLRIWVDSPKGGGGDLRRLDLPQVGSFQSLHHAPVLPHLLDGGLHRNPQHCRSHLQLESTSVADSYEVAEHHRPPQTRLAPSGCHAA